MLIRVNKVMKGEVKNVLINVDHIIEVEPINEDKPTTKMGQLDFLVPRSRIYLDKTVHDQESIDAIEKIGDISSKVISHLKP